MAFLSGGKKNYRKQRENNPRPQYLRLAELNRQRLRGYAESFWELAESLEEKQFREETEKDRQSLLEEQGHLENRQLISNHLSEVAELIHKVAERELCYEPLEYKKEKILVHALRAEGIMAEELCYFPKEQRGQSLGMVLSTGKKGGISGEEVANMLSVLLKCRLEAAVTSPYLVDQEKRSFVFVEEEKLVVFLGLAKAIKETESISGDNFSVLHSEGGKKTILLSDGTGSGWRAGKESSKVLALMEKMAEAGFETEAAVNMVNTAIFAGRDPDSHPTLDICSIDLYSGSCDIYKIGGAATFLKRGKHVEKIRRDSLPLGIFQSVTLQKVQLQLQEGDYLVLVTDGVMDALGEGGETYMEELLRTQPINNPQEMAGKLLQAALKNGGGHIRDDMTILVAGVWEK